MSKRVPKVSIIDMLEAVDAILDYTAGLNYEQYLSDRKTRDAVYRNIGVMGEAANRLPAEFTAKHPEVEWNKIISTRNAIFHGYDEIDDTIVWKIITGILPELKKKLEKILAEINSKRG